MSSVERIKTTFERNTRALSLRPAIGQGTAVTRARLREGMVCEIEEGPWKLTADMTEKSGGSDAGPNPGILARAALSSCLAVGYAMWAAARDIPISGIDVEVQADYDSRGMYGLDDVAAGYREIRCIVTVQSDAAEADVRRVLDEADSHSDILAVFREPQNVSREVRITAPRS